MEICNFVLSRLDSEDAFKLGPTKALVALSEIFQRDPKIILKCFEGSGCPFTQNIIDNFKSTLQRNGRRPKGAKYDSFSHFANHVSARKYVPTNCLYDLLPKLTLNFAERREISLTIPSLQPLSIKKIAQFGFVGKEDNMRMVFINQAHGIFRPTRLESILRICIFVIAWINSLASPEELGCLRYFKKLEPKGQYAIQFTRNLIPAIINQSFSFYAKTLIPAVTNDFVTLSGYIGTNYTQQDETETNDSAAEHCPICRNALENNGVAELVCGHLYHSDCLDLYEESVEDYTRSCSVCRGEYVRI